RRIRRSPMTTTWSTPNSRKSTRAEALGRNGPARPVTIRRGPRRLRSLQGARRGASLGGVERCGHEQAGLLRGAGRGEERPRRGHQEGLSQTGDEAPPRPQPGIGGEEGGGPVQGGERSLRDALRRAEAGRL